MSISSSAEICESRDYSNKTFKDSKYFKGKDLANANFKGADLQNADLTKTNLASANFKGANLTGAKLLSANLENAILENAILKDAILDNANLKGAILNKADLEKANLTGAILINCKMSRVNLIKAKLISCDLSGAILISSKLSGANLTSAALDNANLKEADFYDADLSCAKLNNVRIQQTIFSGAILNKTSITIDDNFKSKISSMVFKKYTEKYKKDKIAKRKKMYKNTIFYNYGLINEDIITVKYWCSEKTALPTNSNSNFKKVHAVPTIPIKETLEDEEYLDESDKRSCCWYFNIKVFVFFRQKMLVILSSFKQLEKSKDEIDTVLKLIESLFYAEKKQDNWSGILEIWKILLDYIENIENRTVFLIVADFIKNVEWEHDNKIERDKDFNIEPFFEQYNIKKTSPREQTEVVETPMYKNICHNKDLDSIIGMYYRLYIETIPIIKTDFDHYFKEELVFGCLNRHVREEYINISERLKNEKRYITLIAEEKSKHYKNRLALAITLGMALFNFASWLLLETHFEEMKTCTNICD